MPITTHEQAKAVIAKDIRIGRAILAYAEKSPHLKFLLGQRLSQSNLFGIVRFLTANKSQWTNETEVNATTIIGGIQRATLNPQNGGAPNTLLYRYEMSHYTPQECLELDPPPPVDTPP